RIRVKSSDSNPNLERGCRMKARLLLAAAACALAAPAAAHEEPDCDRQCLIDRADGYSAAIVAKDPSRAVLAEGAIMVENNKRIAPGEGLWSSLSGPPGEFVIHVADPVSQQVGVMLVAPAAEDKPTMFGIRLKRENGRIT